MAAGDPKSCERQGLLIQGAGVFLIATGFLLTLGPWAPFTKELGTCESGAVRDVLGGNVILPRFLPGPIVHVPPLYWWIAALCVKALGWNELAFRLPSLLAAALTCAIVFVWSGRTLGLHAGWWSAASLLLCHFFLDAARQPRMDSMLALFVTAAVVSLERAIVAREPVNRRRSWYFVAAGAIGLGALSKGIIGIILPGLVVLLFLFIRRRPGDLLNPGLIAAFTTGLATGLAWFMAAYRLGGHPFLQWQLRMNLWDRFMPAAAGGAAYCAHPFWYFAPHIARGFLPWSLYLPAFAVAAWPSRERRLPEPLAYALCWFAALFFFFSASHGKCLVYILPAFPPLAVFIGWTMAEVQGEFGASKWVNQLFSAATVLVALSVLILVIAAILVIVYNGPVISGLRLHPTDRRFLELLVRQGVNPALLVWASLSLVGCSLGLGGWWKMEPIFEMSGILVVAAVAGWFWFGVMNPALARGETLKGFARQAAKIVPANERIGHFGLGDCELNFYSPRPLEPVSRISCTAAGQGEPYIIIREQDLNAIPLTRRGCFVTELEATPNDSIGPRLLVRRSY